MKAFIAATLALAHLALAAPSVAHETKFKDLQIIHPWAHGPAAEIVATPAGVVTPRDVAIYMTVLNNGAYGDRLLAVSSPLAAGAELRIGSRHVDALDVNATGSLKMTAAGAHLVLQEVGDDLAGYEAFPVWLTFERAGRVEIAVIVEDPTVKDPSCTGSLSPSEMHAHIH